MGQFKNFFSTRWGIICVGAFIGVLAPLLQKWGNPGNMGICVACFERDIAGAIGFHRAPELIARAYTHKNAARCLLVKGKQDYVADRQGIQATIDIPMEGPMEAIGGTGDTLTGIVTALIETGMEVVKAATIAARVNRLAGHYANPTPAMQVIEMVQHIPRALSEILQKA